MGTLTNLKKAVTLLKEVQDLLEKSLAENPTLRSSDGLTLTLIIQELCVSADNSQGFVTTDKSLQDIIDTCGISWDDISTDEMDDFIPRQKETVHLRGSFTKSPRVNPENLKKALNEIKGQKHNREILEGRRQAVGEVIYHNNSGKVVDENLNEDKSLDKTSDESLEVVDETVAEVYQEIQETPSEISSSEDIFKSLMEEQDRQVKADLKAQKDTLLDISGSVES